MRWLCRYLIRLYPASWRERYGDELEALVEDGAAGFPAVFDVLKGAIRMQLLIPAFPKLALILSVAGLLAGFGISFLVTPQYVSTAVMTHHSGREGAGSSLPEDLLRSENEILSRTSLKSIIQDPRLELYSKERCCMPLEDVIEKMRKDIRIIFGNARGEGLSCVSGLVCVS